MYDYSISLINHAYFLKHVPNDISSRINHVSAFSAKRH